MQKIISHYARIFSFFFFFIILACSPDNNDSKIKDSIVSPLSLQNLLENIDKFSGKEVVVRGYLNTHDDGPWLSSSDLKPLEDSLILIINSKTNVKLNGVQNSNSFQWFEYQKPFLVQVTGTLRVDNIKTYKGNILKDQTRPFIEVVSCIKLDQARKD
jgi:hypothetical protein